MKNLALKRLIDIIASACLLVLLAPLLLAVAVCVRLALGAPILFCQPRVGKDNRMFNLYKFRSMKAGDGPDEERLTRFGKALRATSLDELPELFNVLRGDMSLVGPRPLLPEYLPYYSAEQQKRHHVRPGLTGWAQVNGRNLLGWEERFAYDVWYVEHWSLLLDMKILFSTVAVVCSRSGVAHAGNATMYRFDDYMKSQKEKA